MQAPIGDDSPSRLLITRILVRSLEYRHPWAAWVGLLFAASLWLFFLGAILCGAGYWWAALPIAVAAVQSLGACRLLSSVQSQPAASAAGRT